MHRYFLVSIFVGPESHARQDALPALLVVGCWSVCFCAYNEMAPPRVRALASPVQYLLRVVNTVALQSFSSNTEMPTNLVHLNEGVGDVYRITVGEGNESSVGILCADELVSCRGHHRV